MPMEEQVVSIFASTPPEGRDSWVRRYALKDIPAYEREMLEYVRTNHGDVLKAIRDSGKLEDDSEQKLAAALDEFADVFQPSSRSTQAA
jgi:F-type H+-transporting ATPase subunit alpha